LTLRRCSNAVDGGIGHQAVRDEVGRTLTFADPRHRFEKDVDLERVQVAGL